MAIIDLANLPNKTSYTLTGTEQIFLNDSGVAKDVTVAELSAKVGRNVVDDVAAQKDLVIAAKVDAEAARDAAIIGSGVYATEADGRAAVDDGVAFKVQGSGDIAAYEYRRTNSETSVLIATYPSKAGIDAIVVAGEYQVGGTDALMFIDPLTNRLSGRVDTDGTWHINAKPINGKSYLSVALDDFPEDFTAVGSYSSVGNDTVLLFLDPDSNRVLMKGDKAGRLYGDFFDFSGNSLTSGTVIDTSPIVYKERLRQTAQRLRSIQLGDSATLSIAVIGDSWTGMSGYWIGAFTAYLQTKFGNAGTGWCGFAFSPSGTILGSVSTTIAVTKSGTWASFYMTGNSPDIGQVVSSTPGDKYTIIGPAGLGVAKLFGESGTVRYRWDGGVWVEVAFTGDLLQTVSLSGIPSTAWTLEIEVVSGTVRLSGLDIRKSSGSGVVIHKLGKNGSNTTHWSGVDAADFIYGMGALQPHLCLIFLGTNDQWLSGGVANTPSQYKTNVATIIERVRAGAPDADILLVTPPSVRSEGSPMTEYSAAMRELAETYKTAHTDLQQFFGDAVSEYEYGASRALLDNTLIHPNTQGRSVIAGAVLHTINCNL